MKDITDINPLIRESKNDGIYIQDENRNYNSLNSIPHEHMPTEKERSTLNLDEKFEKPFSQTGGSDIFSIVNNKDEYRVPRMIQGFNGSFGLFSFIEIKGQTLEVFAGDHSLISLRIRNVNKDYGILKYFQLPDFEFKTKQIKAVKRVFYDEVENIHHEWVFIYALHNDMIFCLIFLSNQLADSQNFYRIRVERILLNGQPFDLEGDLKSIEDIVFGAVANIDSLLLNPYSRLDPERFEYAVELRTELRSFNPFLIHPQDASSAIFSRYPYSPSYKNKSRDDSDVSVSKNESRVIDSCNSLNYNNKNQRPSSVLSNITNVMKSTSGINDGSYFQSPSNPKQPPHFHNPSTDFNPNSVTEISYNPYVCNHHKKFSEFYEGNESHDLCNKSKLSINENDKSISPDYVGEYRRDTGDRFHIEKIASPISQVPSHGRLNELSSVTEEAIDTFEQSENAQQSLKKSQNRNLNNIFQAQYQQHDNSSISEESEYEEEEDEDEEECESEISEETEQHQPVNVSNHINPYNNANWQPQKSINSSYYYPSIEYEQDNNRFGNWIKLLKLPRNTHAFNQLVNKGVHPAFKYLHEKYPLEERELYEKYIKILSCLGYWCDFLTEVDFFPVLVFPFVKLIEHSDLIICETIMSLILNWCKHWFEYYPKEPIHILQIINEIVQHEDYSLNQHFRSKGFSAKDYAWPIVRQLFSEIMCEEDWCILMDILFSYPEKQNLIYYFAAAMVIEHKKELLQIRDIEELKFYNYPFIQNNIPELMSRALSYHDYYNEALVKQLGISNDFEQSNFMSLKNSCQFPLPIGYYPIFNQHPKEFSPIERLEKTVLDDLESARTKLKLVTDQKYSEINQEMESANHRSEMIRIEQENMRKLYVEKAQRLIEQTQRDQQSRAERIQKIKDMEKYMIDSMQTNDMLRKQHMALISEQFKLGLTTIQEHTKSKLEDENIMSIEHKSNQRMMELLDLQAREERNEILKQQWMNLEKEKELFNQKKMIDTSSNNQINVIRRLKQKEMESQEDIQNINQMSNELKIMKMKHSLEKDNYEKLRDLRKVKEEVSEKHNIYKEELKTREKLLQQQEDLYKDKYQNEDFHKDQQRIRNKMEQVENSRKELKKIIDTK